MSEAESKIQNLIDMLGDLRRTTSALDDIKDYVNGLRERVRDLSIDDKRKEELIGLLNQWLIMLHGYVIEAIINELNKATKG
jgi:ABC-type uncharacterized transport system ATPase subunit